MRKTGGTAGVSRLEGAALLGLVSSIANTDHPSMNLCTAQHCIGAMSVQADALSRHAPWDGMLVRADARKLRNGTDEYSWPLRSQSRRSIVLA
jgi:hypothetical protein